MKKRLNVRTKLYLSYFIIAMIPIMIATSTYSYTVRVMRRQEERINQSLLEYVRQTIDLEFQRIQVIQSQLCINKRLQVLSIESDPLTTQKQMEIYDLYKDLEAITLSDHLIGDVFICFNKEGRVCSSNGNMNLAMYHTLLLEKYDMSVDEFREYLSKPHFNDVVFLNSEGNADRLLFTTTILDANARIQAATIGVLADYNTIAEQMKSSSKINQEREFFLVHKTRIKGTDLKTKYGDIKIDYENVPLGSEIGEASDNEKYMVTILDSKICDLYYVTITPYDIVTETAKQVQMVFYAVTMLCIVFGCLLSFLMTKKYYNPVNQLVRTLKSQGSIFDLGNETNEYQWINQQIKRYFQENTDLQTILKSDRKYLKQFYLCQLLQETYVGKNINQYGINFPMEYNLVILLSPKSDVYHQQTNEEQILQRFIISNIFGEMCEGKFSCEVFELGEKIATIINLSSDDKGQLTAIKDIIGNVRQITEESFGFECQALVGEIKKGLPGIHTSYQEALAMEEYINLLEESFLCFEEVKELTPHYDYPVEIEEKIIQAITIGQADAAIKYMTEIIEKNLKKKTALDVYRCLIYDMTSTLLKSANQIGYKNVTKALLIPDAKSEHLSISVIKEMFTKDIIILSGEVKNTKKEFDNDHSFCKKVDKYIGEHYREPNLNISITSLYFSKTPAYVSALYKKQTGKSLLQEITNLRIKYAKQLLLKGVSVVDAAEQSGFRDSGSFIRAFKKNEGITPGQIKSHDFNNGK